MSRRDKNGIARRDHLKQVEKVKGRPLEELRGPPFPERLEHVWDAFLGIHLGRSYSSGGPNPLSWSDIKAWNDLLDAGLQEWEIRAIKALDMVWLTAMSEDTEHD